MSQMLPGHHHVPVRHLYEDMFSRGRYEMLNQVFHSTCPVHFGNRHLKLQEAVEEGKQWRSAAPNLVMTIDQISEIGDMVQVSWTARGTHTGQGHGLRPTGRQVVLKGKSKFRVMNGKILEAWNEEYRPELLRQLGVSGPKSFTMLFVMNLWTTIKGVLSSLAS